MSKIAPTSQELLQQQKEQNSTPQTNFEGAQIDLKNRINKYKSDELLKNYKSGVTAEPDLYKVMSKHNITNPAQAITALKNNSLSGDEATLLDNRLKAVGIDYKNLQVKNSKGQVLSNPTYQDIEAQGPLNEDSDVGKVFKLRSMEAQYDANKPENSNKSNLLTQPGSKKKMLLEPTAGNIYQTIWGGGQVFPQP